MESGRFAAEYKRRKQFIILFGLQPRANTERAHRDFQLYNFVLPVGGPLQASLTYWWTSDNPYTPNDRPGPA